LGIIGIEDDYPARQIIFRISIRNYLGPTVQARQDSGDSGPRSVLLLGSELVCTAIN